MFNDKKFKNWIKNNYPKWTKKKIKKNKEKLRYKYNFERCLKEGNQQHFYFYFNEYHIDKEVLNKSKSFYDLVSNLNNQQVELDNEYPLERKDGFFFYDIWARYIKKDFLGNKKILVYSDITSLENYIEMVLNEYVDKLLDRYIPHFYLDEEFDQDFCKKKTKKYCILNDKTLKADGKEELLDNVKKHWYSIYHTYFIPLIIKEIKEHRNKTFRIENYKKHDYSVIEIIGGKEAAENIKVETFLYDFHKLQQPEQIVKNSIKKLKKEIKKKIKEIIKTEEKKLDNINNNIDNELQTEDKFWDEIADELFKGKNNESK